MTTKPLRIMFNPLRRAMARSVPGSTTVARFLLWSSLVFACVLVGLMVAALPYWFIIAMAVAPIFFALVAWRMEYGVLAVLALASGIVDQAFLPTLSLLRAEDLAIVVVIAITIIGGHKLSNGFQPSELKLWIPFGIFLLIVPVSIVYAYFFQGVSIKDVLGEGRHLMYLLLLPISAAVLNTKQHVRRFIFGLLVLGVLFSLGQILQSIFHIRIFGDAGRLATLQTLDIKSYDTTISSTGGINIIMFVMFMVAAWYTLRRIGTFKFLAIAALTAVGILLTFGRTTWGVTLLGMVVVTYLLGLRKSGPMLIWSLVGASLAFAALIATKPVMFDALVTRATSIGEEIEHGSSAAWRYYEAEEVIPKIIANPVLGIGLGAAYRRPSPVDFRPEQVRYIHNGYLYMVSKLGVPALSLFLWCLWIVLFWSWHGVTKERDPEFRGVHAAIFAGIISILLASITEPHLMRDSSIAYLGVMAGLAIVLKRIGCEPMRNGNDARVTASVSAVPLHVIAKAEGV